MNPNSGLNIADLQKQKKYGCITNNYDWKRKGITFTTIPIDKPKTIFLF